VILEGVTRASVLDLVRSGAMGEDVDVTERKFNMQELIAAQDEGRLIEAFGAGTAFFIAPVQDIHFRGVDLVLPLGKGVGKDGGRGDEFAQGVKTSLKDIMYGRREHEWGVVVEEQKI